MKNNILIIFLIFILSSCGEPKRERLSIAILTPVSHPSLEQIEAGFKEAIEATYPGKYAFSTYNAQGNKMLMRSEIEEIIQSDFSLVFTIGTTASQMTAEVFRKKGLDLPIVFTSVNDPTGFQIVSSEGARGENITGVKELLRFEDELASLLSYKPEIQNILLVYNPHQPGLQKDRNEIGRILRLKGIDLQTVEVFQTNEILNKTSPFISQADAVVILKDNTVVTGVEALVKLCDSHQIPLMASDLDSPDRGVAFGYGVHERDFGTEGAYKVLQILEEGIDPGAIPVTPVSNFQLRINGEAAKRQGVIL